MQILIISSYLPSLSNGGEIRLFQLMRFLSRHHQITLFSVPYNCPLSEAVKEPLSNCKFIIKNVSDYQEIRSSTKTHNKWYWRFNQAYCAFFRPLPDEVHNLFSEEIQTELKDLIIKEDFDLIHVNQIFIWKYISWENRIPKVLSKDNVWAIYYKRLAKTLKKPTHRLWKEIEAHKISRYETKAVRSSNVTTVVSAQDKSELSKMVPDANIHVLSNGIDLEYFTPSDVEPNKNTLVFTGTMNWYPNVDAILYFYNTIFPILLRDFLDLELHIMG